MSPKRTLQPHETWDALLKMARDDEIERVAGLSDEELDRELAAEGFDPRVLRARGAELAEKLKYATPMKAKGGRSAFPRTAATIAAGAVAAAIPIVVLEVANHKPVESGGPEAATVTPHERAEAMRRAAARACQERHWQECRRWLDDAERLDPAGEGAPEVIEMRRALDVASSPPVEALPTDEGKKPKPR